MQRVRVSSHQTPVHKLGQTQITLSPKFKLASTSPELTSLIPNLPDDVALNCLLRTAVGTHSSCRLVCRKWNAFFSQTGNFFALRKKLGVQKGPYLFTFAFDRCTTKLHWLAYDLANSSWFRLPPMPRTDTVCPHGISCIPLSDDSILVCGGSTVLKYELPKHKWSAAARMRTPRSFFGGGAIGGIAYAAGGCGRDRLELDSCEAFDVKENGWTRVGNMRARMTCFDSCVVGGKMYVTEGWVWPLLASPIGQVYDPKEDAWTEMKAGMREGWVGPCAVARGRAFVVAEREGMRARVYDEEGDEWVGVEGLPVPEGVKGPVVVCGDGGGRIFVVGTGLRVAVGCVEALGGDGGRRRFGVRWEDVGDLGLMELTPSSAMVLFG